MTTTDSSGALDIPVEGRNYPRLFNAILQLTTALKEGGDDVSSALRESFRDAVEAFGAEKALLLEVGGTAEKPTLKTLEREGLTDDQIQSCEAGLSVRGVSSSVIRRAIDSHQAQIIQHPSFTRAADKTAALEGENFSVICSPILDPDNRRTTLAVLYFQNTGYELERAYREDDSLALASYCSVLETTLASHFLRRRLEDRVANLTKEARPANAPEIIGSSKPSMELRRELHEFLVPAADEIRPQPVLVLGETGTGKDLIARYIHAWSSRRDKGYRYLNCAEVSDNVDMAKDCFAGHVKGAFTGADSDSPGLFRETDGGVLFLDEIGDLSLVGQNALLGILANYEISPLGGAHAPSTTVDTLVVLATNRDLDKAVEEGTIKHDFLARFSAQRLHLLPLRDRPADIPDLAQHFINQREKLARKRTMGLAPETLAALIGYRWPNNVRQLFDVCTTLVSRTKPGRPIVLETLARSYPDIVGEQSAAPITTQSTLKDSVDAFSRQLLIARLQEHPTISAAAQSLGITRSGIYRQMERLGVQSPARDDD